MSTPPKTFVTPEEYLERERKAEYMCEYWQWRRCSPVSGEPEA